MSYQLFWAVIGAAIVLATVALVVGARAWQARRQRTRVEVTTADGERRVVSVQALDAADAAGGTRSVDRIDITNWTATGLNTPIARYTMTLEFWWTDNDGTQRHYGPATHTWPNDLAGIPLRVLKEWAEQIVVQAVRWQIGVDPPPEP